MKIKAAILSATGRGGRVNILSRYDPPGPKDKIESTLTAPRNRGETLLGTCSVERIKGCQMAGHSIGKAWQREKGKSLETRCVESLLVVYVLCVSCL